MMASVCLCSPSPPLQSHHRDIEHCTGKSSVSANRQSCPKDKTHHLGRVGSASWEITCVHALQCRAYVAELFASLSREQRAKTYPLLA